MTMTTIKPAQGTVAPTASATVANTPPTSPMRSYSTPIRGSSTMSSSSSSNGGGSSNHPYTPHYMTPLNGGTTSNNCTPNRSRMNSRDLPRSYSGMFGQGGRGCDLLPFELSRNWHTDWLENGGLLLLLTYMGVIVVFELLVFAVLDVVMNGSSTTTSTATTSTITAAPALYWSWTITNAVHCVLSTLYLHWLKGSLFDDQGEMAAMTLWEQLEGRPRTIHVKRALTIVPTLLCYAACHFSDYEYHICQWNVILWLIHVGAKLPMMNGVRIFGINRTTGIDDYTTEDVIAKDNTHNRKRD